MSALIKICGIRTDDALEAAISEGADYIGLVFFEKSPRHVDFETAQRLASRARWRTKIVALVVDPADQVVAKIVDRVRPDLLQFHGSETVARVAGLRVVFDLPVIKAFKVAVKEDVEAALAYKATADIILFDAAPPTGAAVPGGHGATFDWPLLDAVKGQMPFMLSGGLTPDNVAAAIVATGASAVDVSSGVESAPGVKDPARIRAFIQAVKTANQSPSPAES